MKIVKFCQWFCHDMPSSSVCFSDRNTTSDCNMLHKLEHMFKFYYINLGVDIGDECHCWSIGISLLVHDIGVFGSRDSLAIGEATLQVTKDTLANPDSMIVDIKYRLFRFAASHGCKDPETGEVAELAEKHSKHAEKMDLGNREYELVILTRNPSKRQGPR